VTNKTVVLWRVAVLFLFGALAVGCRYETSAYYSLSPDRRWKLVVATEGLTVKSHLIIHLVSGKKDRTIYSDTGEWYPPFLIAYWSEDRRLVGVYATNPLGAPPSALVAYDLQNDRVADGESVPANIRQEIAKQYGPELPRNEQNSPIDPLSWALTAEANASFQARLNEPGGWIKQR